MAEAGAGGGEEEIDATRKEAEIETFKEIYGRNKEIKGSHSLAIKREPFGLPRLYARINDNKYINFSVLLRCCTIHQKHNRLW